VAISTPNLERALAFYCHLLGFEEVMRTEWSPGTEQIDKVLDLNNSAARQVMLKLGNLCIELFQFSSPEPARMSQSRPVCDHGHTHLCLDVINIHHEYQRLVEAGVEFHAPPQHFGPITATYGRDPDGNVFELQELHQADDPARLRALDH